MIEALRSSETSVLTRATRCNILEDGILHVHRRKNLKSYIELTGWALCKTCNIPPVRQELYSYIPEDGILHNQCRKNLNSYTEIMVSNQTRDMISVCLFSDLLTWL
jgi:hypothetical protein